MTCSSISCFQMVADEAGLKLSSELETALSGPVKKSAQTASAVDGELMLLYPVASTLT